MKTTNLSKLKREKMLNTLNEIKKKISDDSILNNLTLIENELNNKKYGLIWEEHQERVDWELQTQIPVFENVKNKEIYNDKDKHYNFLLEGDNLHSLYLLEKTHKGKIDVIYIDPPYNTGAKTWKYNNNYVDKNDLFAHSKWLSMMNNRLVIAKKLLSDNGALICSIDENELCSLGLLLNEIFGEGYEIHPITIVHNPRGIQGKNFSYTHEYAYFVFKRGEKVIGNRKIEPEKIDWSNLRNWGGESSR
ncbi:MAG: DNA methyltransferase, partial [Bacilli bacterium]